jgi:undecaprenyl-diphosphatase
MVTAALWGLVQGLTEFLPVSSSGHLVLVPALLGIDEPDLATSAVLHLGTLLAVLWYFRRELFGLLRHPATAENRRLWKFLIIGTIPAAVIGLTLRSPIEVVFTEPWIVAICLVITGVILLAAHRLADGERRVAAVTTGDAAIIGMAQAFALLPGISRSGMTITGGLVQGMSRPEAARLGFLLGVPAILGAGGLELLDLIDQGGFDAEVLVGMVVAAASGYFAISTLIRMIGRFGLLPFALYCIGFGALAYFLV